MAMCARKELEKELQERRAAFRKKMGDGFLEELKSRIDCRMVVVHEQQKKRKEFLRRAHENNRNMVITR